MGFVNKLLTVVINLAVWDKACYICWNVGAFDLYVLVGVIYEQSTIRKPNDDDAQEAKPQEQEEEQEKLLEMQGSNNSIIEIKETLKAEDKL